MGTENQQGRVISIDTGLRHCGVSKLLNRELVSAMLVSSGAPKAARGAELWRMMVSAVWREAALFFGSIPGTLVIEFPKVYFGGKSEVPAADLMDLGAVVGGLVATADAHGSGAVVVLPSTWKKQMPKGVTQERVLERLTAMEQRGIILCGAKSHNVFDSVGIGLWYAGRFKRKRYTGRGQDDPR